LIKEDASRSRKLTVVVEGLQALPKSLEVMLRGVIYNRAKALSGDAKLFVSSGLPSELLHESHVI